MAFAITQLAWGGLESRPGYEAAREMGNLLKAIRWGTDYFVRAHVDDEVLFGMVSLWITLLRKPCLLLEKIRGRIFFKLNRNSIRRVGYCLTNEQAANW